MKELKEIQRYTWALHSLRAGCAVGTIQEHPEGEYVKYSDLPEAWNTRKDITPEIIWDALCCNSVKNIGYKSDSKWIPVNMERLKAAIERISK